MLKIYRFISLIITLQYLHLASLENTNLETIFTEIYTQKKGETPSGVSSTSVIKNELPKIIKLLGIKTLLDIPCGDWHWMKEIALGLEYYFGGDIVCRLARENQLHYGSKKTLFLHLDATKDELPRVDAILCRDLFSHLSFHHSKKALKNFKKSGARYLLVSNYTKCNQNIDISDGDWHAVNLRLAPFNFPEPLLSFDEQLPLYLDTTYGKHLAIWLLDDIKI